MLIELIKILLPYILGMVCMGVMFPPMKDWQEGYNAAKQCYGDWKQWYEKGWNNAKEVFEDYDRGFGDGFEAGWITAEEQRGEQK